MNLGKYKRPRAYDENGNELNQSNNDLLSHFDKNSNLDDAIQRKKALQNLFDHLDLKTKGENMFGDQI